MQWKICKAMRCRIRQHEGENPMLINANMLKCCAGQMLSALRHTCSAVSTSVTCSAQQNCAHFSV